MAQIYKIDDNHWGYGTNVYASYSDAKRAEEQETKRLFNTFNNSAKSSGNEKSGSFSEFLLGCVIIGVAIFLISKFGLKNLISIIIGIIVTCFVGGIIIGIIKSKKQSINNQYEENINYSDTTEAQYDNISKAVDEAWELYHKQEYGSAFTKATELSNVDPQATALLGILYNEGLGCEQNFEEAFKCFEMSRNYNYEAQNYYALMLLDGQGCAKNEELGREELIKAGEIPNNYYGKAKLGEYLLMGDYGFEINDKKAIELLREAEACGYIFAKFLLGMAFYKGTENYPEDKEKGYNLIKEAADLGDPIAKDFAEELCKNNN